MLRFSGFINDLVADSYCRDFGSPAKEPEMMAKVLTQRLKEVSLDDIYGNV